MSPERASAYRRVTRTLHELGPSKLWDHEQDLIRSAADTLIFSADPAEDAAAREALEDVDRLCRALVDSGRWEEVTAACLAEDLACCGPPRPVALRAA